MKTTLIAASSLILAASAGFLTSTALSGPTQEPTRTVTINVATGPTGPRGEPGPPGSPGPKGDTGPAGLQCPTGFSEGDLVINHPGGQVTVFTCLKNP